MKDKGNELYTSSCIQTRTLRESPDGALGILLDRSKRMDRKQKALLWMILDQGASYHQVARLSGEHASTVSRRFRAMVRRLRGRPLENAKTALSNLTPLDKTILIESFVYGASQKQIATKLGVSRYRVRKALAEFS